MKKLVILIFFLIFSGNFYAQILLQAIIRDAWQGSSWDNYQKELFTYDGNLFLKVHESQVWEPGISAYRGDFKTAYTNAVDGTVQQAIDESWQPFQNVWYKTDRRTYIYNTANQPLIIDYLNFAGTYWQPYRKISNTYDGSGYLTNSLFQYCNTPGVYENGSQISYTNNINGTIQQSIEQTWNSTLNTWQNLRRVQYTYNSTNKPLTVVTDGWANGNWYHETKTINTYNNNGYLVKELNQNWDFNSLVYQDFKKYDNAYNTDGTIDHSLLYKSPGPGSWNFSERATYIYIDVTGLPELKGEVAFQCFPNPGKDVLNISLNDNIETIIKISDLKGKMVLETKPFRNTTVLDIKDLPSNLYLVRLEQENKTSIKKFIKN